MIFQVVHTSIYKETYGLPPRCNVQLSYGLVYAFISRSPLFNHTIIHAFMGQRHAMKPFGQFSVLLLVPSHAVGQRSLELIPHQPDRPCVPLLDNALFMSPHIKDAVTYLSARPGGKEHSEEKLLRYFRDLEDNFVRFYGEPPAVVILYTWLMPCRNCIDMICWELNANTGIACIVVYSTGENKPEADVDYMMSRPQSNGIVVLKEECQCTAQEVEQGFFMDLREALNRYTTYPLVPQT